MRGDGHGTDPAHHDGAKGKSTDLEEVLHPDWPAHPQHLAETFATQSRPPARWMKQTHCRRAIDITEHHHCHHKPRNERGPASTFEPESRRTPITVDEDPVQENIQPHATEHHK